jgi:hypothetical protein
MGIGFFASSNEDSRFKDVRLGAHPTTRAEVMIEKG